MERLDIGLGKYLYYSSSIGEMLDNREVPINDILNEIGLYQPQIDRKKRVGIWLEDNNICFNISIRLIVPPLLVGFLSRKRNSRIYASSSSNIYVYIPMVRHHPFTSDSTLEIPCDTHPTNNRLTIYDRTTDLELLRLNNSQLNLLSELERPNFHILKSHAWCSDIVLNANYQFNCADNDKYGLYSVRNTKANQSSKEAAREFANRFLVTSTA